MLVASVLAVLCPGCMGSVDYLRHIALVPWVPPCRVLAGHDRNDCVLHLIHDHQTDWLHSCTSVDIGVTHGVDKFSWVPMQCCAEWSRLLHPGGHSSTSRLFDS